MLSYTYSSIADYERTAPGNTTGAFKTQFTRLLTTVIAPTAIQQKQSVAATVKRVGIITANPRHVVLLVLLDQTTTSTTDPNGASNGSRERVTMSKVDGTWLVAALTPI